MFTTFKIWKAKLENEAGLNIKCLRSNNGGEYDNKQVKEVSADNGIKMTSAVPIDHNGTEL